VLLTGTSPQQVIAAVQGPTPTPVVVYSRPQFQTGVVFPQWGPQGYSATNTNYGVGLGEIRDQTAARWIEIPVNLYQSSNAAFDIGPTSYTPTPQSLHDGIVAAHAAGYHVFITPLISVGTSGWSGNIRFATTLQTAHWFDVYWLALEPYVAVAAQAGAEQFAIGTEMSGLERAAHAALWKTLIARVRTLFSGSLTYDMNFTTVQFGVRSWMENSDLTYIGVSAYYGLVATLRPRYGLVATPQRVPADQVPLLWQEFVQAPLDAFAEKLGRPILISEIGYRNSADCLYNPYLHSTTAAPDPEEQAAAYNAAVQDSVVDPWITGIYFWAWSLPPFKPNWLPAAQVLHNWYNSPAA
jgi:hypothetical protein